MGTVTKKLVKRTALSWWTRESTKGGSLPKNGRPRRAISARLFRWRGSLSHSAPAEDPVGLNGDSRRAGCHDTVSLLLRDALVERFGAEQAAREGGLINGRVAAPQPDVSVASPQSASFESAGRMPSWKRALDLALVAVTYPLWLPLMLLVMAAIKISSPGPIFYRQERVGFRGRPFMIFKFRSMKVRAETSSHELHFERLMRGGAPMTKLDAGDPRIFPWGRVLRATGLDELPQLFNVLRGEMSLVGTRPCTRLEFEKYEEWQRARVNAVPGLTGYWQVSGKNNTTFQEMIEMDLFYAKNASVGLDLWIMAKTPAALFDQTLEVMQKRAVKLANASSQTAQANGANGDCGV